MTETHGAAAQHDTLSVMMRFNAAVNAGNLQAIAALLTASVSTFRSSDQGGVPINER
jgi:hypothetical protein